MDDRSGAFYSILKTSLSSLPPSRDHEHETVLAVPITRNPPKCAAKPAANHIALVICGQMQCGFGFIVLDGLEAPTQGNLPAQEPRAGSAQV